MDYSQSLFCRELMQLRVSRISGKIVNIHWAALQLVVSRAALAASERHMQLSRPLNLLLCHTLRDYDTHPCQRG
jgi:hypothetical protein